MIKDANDALRRNEDICRMIEDARPLEHADVETFEFYKESVRYAVHAILICAILY